MQDIAERRKTEAPDIVIGQAALWIGMGDGLSWPWLDVAIRIGDGWEKALDVNGPLLQRPDVLAFVPALRAFVARERSEVRLASLGGSMRLSLSRSETGWLRGEAKLDRGALSQTIGFPLREELLAPALAGAEAVAARLASEDRGWRPDPARLAAGEAPRPPRDSGIAREEDPLRAPFEPWDAGLGAGEDVAFTYTHDGYGWYSVQVRLGERSGEFGGGYLTDPMGDLLRAGLALLADAWQAELTCNAEPGLTRVRFERVTLGGDVLPDGRPLARHGCRISICDVRSSGEEQPPEFDALCRSPRAVAEAVYAMALAHFADDAGPWSAPMAALEAALAAVPDE
ncbi:hypothetical protein [Sphingomonas parva]|uniref:hypothetical protein n=1 Tax=Sphingomonas parva TaxID=2555898 RepID=UPI001430AC0A|nr:hypothetical protein [Sphingomonas parva]